jgi:hypothetical protein
MKAFKIRASPQKKAKDPASMKVVKRRASPPRKAKEKKPKTTTVNSDSDSHFSDYDDN